MSEWGRTSFVESVFYYSYSLFLWSLQSEFKGFCEQFLQWTSSYRNFWKIHWHKFWWLPFHTWALDWVSDSQIPLRLAYWQPEDEYDKSLLFKIDTVEGRFVSSARRSSFYWSIFTLDIGNRSMVAIFNRLLLGESDFTHFMGINKWTQKLRIIVMQNELFLVFVSTTDLNCSRRKSLLR